MLGNNWRLRFRIFNVLMTDWFGRVILSLGILLLISRIMCFQTNHLFILFPCIRRWDNHRRRFNDSSLNEKVVMVHLLDTSSLLELILIEPFNIMIASNLDLTIVFIVETFLPFFEVILELRKLVSWFTLLVLVYISLVLPARTQLGHRHRVKDIFGTSHFFISI